MLDAKCRNGAFGKKHERNKGVTEVFSILEFGFLALTVGNISRALSLEWISV
jgi:hypothetical protein